MSEARSLRVGVGVDRPFAGRRVGHQRKRQRPPAEPLITNARALILDAVGTFDDQRQRQPRLGDTLGVAEERRDEDGLAGAIDAAFGVEEGVERARRVAPGNAAIGQVERALRQIEKTVVVAERGDEQAERRPAHAARQAGIEIDAPVRAGLANREHLVVARDQAHFDALDRRGRRQ